MATPLSNNTFLHLILEGCAITEKEELTALLSKLGGEMSDLKFRVKEVIEDRYVNFTKLAQEHRHLLNKARSLRLDVDELVAKVEKRTTPSLKESTGEIYELTASLQEVCLMSTFVNHLLDIDTAFQTVNRLRDKMEYREMARAFARIRDMLDDPPSRDNNLEIYEALANEYTLQCSAFMDDMQTVLRECIKFETKKSDGSDQTCTLRVDVGRSDEISQAFPALNHLEGETLYSKRFAEKIFSSMLAAIVGRGASAVSEQDGTSRSLVVEVAKTCEGGKRSHEAVFENVLRVFQFVQCHLGVSVDDDITLLNKMGASIGEDFSNLLVEHCLSEAVPSHTSQLSAYSVVADDTATFRTQLIDLGFLKQEDTTLLDYVSNVESLCANKTSRTLLDKAREVMKKDLYDMMEIEEQTDVAEDEDENIKTENTCEIKPEADLSGNTFGFPRCRISRSASELLCLIRGILLECAGSSDTTCAVRLFYTARNVVELYCAVAPAHHRHNLEVMPQHVALFYNNCMYLSHHLMTVGDAHRNLLPATLHDHLLTFVDQVTELRTIGTAVFLRHMEAQRNRLADMIRDCGFARLGSSSDVASGTEKALRQCMRQLELLQSVWQPVLPENVYCKALGCLLDAFVDDLVARVLTAEDIPVDAATQLVEMFGNVADRMPNVFREPKEIHRHVKKWRTFVELRSILGANLREISDGWGNGKGPIARLFQPGQVKQLVRALFQNTERRSAFLLGIK